MLASVASDEFRPKPSTRKRRGGSKSRALLEKSERAPAAGLKRLGWSSCRRNHFFHCDGAISLVQIPHNAKNKNSRLSIEPYEQSSSVGILSSEDTLLFFLFSSERLSARCAQAGVPVAGGASGYFLRAAVLGDGFRVHKPPTPAMSTSGSAAFVALQLVVKFLDSLFWLFGKGFVASLFGLIGAIARAILGEDPREGGGGDDFGGAGGRSRRKHAIYPANTPPHPRVVEAAKGDQNKLKEKHKGWVQWYADVDGDTLLHRPKPGFEIVKAFYPHSFHKTTKQGFAVQLEKPGQFPTLLRELRERGFANPTQTVVEHISFVMSHAFDTIDTRTDVTLGRILRVVDMSRLDSSDTSYEAYKFLNAMANVSSIAFPERVHKVVIVNPPAVFNILWSVFSPVVSARTMARVRICKTTEDARETLLEDLKLKDIPREYGGECDCDDHKNTSATKQKLGSETSRDDGFKTKYSYDGGGARLANCPSASCTSCWRDSDLERGLWNRVGVCNGGHDGVVGISGGSGDGGDERNNDDRKTSRVKSDSGDPSSPRRLERPGSRTDSNRSRKQSGTDQNRVKRRSRKGLPVSFSGGNVQSLTQSVGDVETVLVGVRSSKTPQTPQPEQPPTEKKQEEEDDASNGSWSFFG